ncbi:hypothetical protein JW721_01375 [Candidatus Micrarchaeota archaeon]|nr:hypothetical protein [Candidatus Micrarchaeota archaeon]
MAGGKPIKVWSQTDFRSVRDAAIAGLNGDNDILVFKVASAGEGLLRITVESKNDPSSSKTGAVREEYLSNIFFNEAALPAQVMKVVEGKPYAELRIEMKKPYVDAQTAAELASKKMDAGSETPEEAEKVSEEYEKAMDKLNELNQESGMYRIYLFNTRTGKERDFGFSASTQDAPLLTAKKEEQGPKKRAAV